MELMSKYCKAYPISELQKFPEWGAHPGAPKEAADQKGDEQAILYVHDDFVVTEGICRSEGIVFDGVGPAWIEYCRGVLQFDPAVVLES
jgi:hypothetical protein